MLVAMCIPTAFLCVCVCVCGLVAMAREEEEDRREKKFSVGRGLVGRY